MHKFPYWINIPNLFGSSCICVCVCICICMYMSFVKSNEWNWLENQAVVWMIKEQAKDITKATIFSFLCIRARARAHALFLWGKTYVMLAVCLYVGANIYTLFLSFQRILLFVVVVASGLYCQSECTEFWLSLLRVDLHWFFSHYCLCVCVYLCFLWVYYVMYVWIWNCVLAWLVISFDDIWLLYLSIVIIDILLPAICRIPMVLFAWIEGINYNLFGALDFSSTEWASLQNEKEYSREKQLLLSSSLLMRY